MCWFLAFWPGNCRCLSELSIPTGLEALNKSRVCQRLQVMQAQREDSDGVPFCADWVARLVTLSLRIDLRDRL